MSDIHKKWKQFLLNEAGLTRVRQDMLDYDTAFITAYRGDINDTSMCVYTPTPEEDLSESKTKRTKRDKLGKRGDP